MTDIGVTEKVGVVAYFPPGDGDMYGMLIEFSDTSDVFYVFYANNTDMYGRYWLISEGDSPSGDGSYFRGSVDTMQKPYPGGGGGGESTAHVEAVLDSDSKIKVATQKDMKSVEISIYSKTKEPLNQQFTEQSVQMAFEKLTARLKSKESQME